MSKDASVTLTRMTVPARAFAPRTAHPKFQGTHGFLSLLHKTPFPGVPNPFRAATTKYKLMPRSVHPPARKSGAVPKRLIDTVRGKTENKEQIKPSHISF